MRWSETAPLCLQVASNIDDSAAARPGLSNGCREEFLKLCWNIDLGGDPDKLSEYDQYFQHYGESCAHLPPGARALTHNHMCAIASMLLTDTRKDILDNTLVSTWFPRSVTSDLSKVVEVVTHAVLMVQSKDWKLTETFAQFLSRKLPKSGSPDHYRLPRSFNLRTFAMAAGISPSWTRDLLSHLRVGENDETISVFHYMEILDMLEGSKFKTIFPVDSIEELRRSIWLLLPLNDRRFERWAHKQQSKVEGLGLKLGHYEHIPPFKRNMEDFDYFRDRLIIAKDASDNSQPSGLLQAWYDDRNKVQWWTFWIAIVVFLLTLVGVIEGALQVFKAYYPSPQ